MLRYRRSFLLFSLSYVALEYAWIYFVPSQLDAALVLEALPPLISALVLFAVFRAHPGHERWFWLLLAFGSVMYAIAQLYWSGYEWIYDIPAPVPSISDLLWAMQSVFLVIALVYLLVRVKNAFQGFRFLFDAIILAVSVTALSCEFIAKPAIETIMEATDSWMLTATVTFYPMADVFIIGCLFMAHFVYGKLFHARVMRALTFGLLLNVCADSLYLLLVANGNFDTALWIGPFWSLGLFLIALAGMASVELKVIGTPKVDSANADLMRIAYPYATLIALLFVMMERGERWDMISIASALIIICILVRQIIVLLENDALCRKLQSSLERTRFLANHDPLSNLPNRRCFEMKLSEAIARAERDRLVLAVMLIDLDRFKYVNDNLGHLAGDRMIRIVADRLRSLLQEPIAIARQGGDEFTVLIERVEQNDNLSQLANRIGSTIAAPLPVDGHEIRSSASIGIAVYPQDGTDAYTLMKNADAAMYRAKSLGGGRHHPYTQQLKGDLFKRWTMEHALRKAYEQNELMLYYQPQVSADDGSIVGVEALLRWRTSSGQLVNPAEFIPLAEETALIVPIGDWVLLTACRQAQLWRKSGWLDVEMAVNVSPKQLEQDDFVERVQAILIETAMQPHLLMLEITESAAISETGDAARKLAELKSLGIRLAMDDFGTGYSSLGHLRTFGVDTLKIAQSFIRDVAANNSLASIVRAIVAMSSSLGLTIVAEGVEEESEYVFLRSIGCDRIQGYYFYKPMPKHDMEQLLMESVS